MYIRKKAAAKIVGNLQPTAPLALSSLLLRFKNPTRKYRIPKRNCSLSIFFPD